MTVTFADPPEHLPKIGTVESAAVFYDGADALLAYEIAPVAGGGIAILAFDHVFDLRVLPLTVESLGQADLPASPYAITEVFGSPRTTKWTALAPRLWTLSFNDELIEIVFRKVELIDHAADNRPPSEVLAKLIATRR